ncbi:hypothetical protein [Streptomyces sp. NPDC058084]|uniref:hypothetical protein n=1 Tax=Streptomyces sp. NPDC058084 TaxID=3346333 RepID=UPI0036E2BB10
MITPLGIDRTGGGHGVVHRYPSLVAGIGFVTAGTATLRTRWMFTCQRRNARRPVLSGRARPKECRALFRPGPAGDGHGAAHPVRRLPEGPGGAGEPIGTVGFA